MKSMYVYLDSIEKVKGLVNALAAIDGDFDLVSGRYVVDAKSIMGIFSLDISKKLRLDIHNEDAADKVTSALAQFIVE